MVGRPGRGPPASAPSGSTGPPTRRPPASVDLPTLGGLDRRRSACTRTGTDRSTCSGSWRSTRPSSCPSTRRPGRTATVTLTDAVVLEFTLGGGPTDQAEVFVGVGAVVDVTAGTINTDDAIGLDADVDELTLAIVTTGGTSPVSYTGLSISESVRGAWSGSPTWSPRRPRQRAGQHGRPTRPCCAAGDRRPARLGQLHAGHRRARPAHPGRPRRRRQPARGRAPDRRPVRVRGGRRVLPAVQVRDVRDGRRRSP